MKRIALAALVFFATTVMTPAAGLAAASALAPASTLTIPVVGSGGGATFTGTFQLQKFATQQGQLVAVGLLSGTVTPVTNVGTTATSAATGPTTATSILKTVALPAAVTDSTCDLLHLDLGPLSLDLLGLKIDLSRIVLDITAQSGAGNLLGNLLCGVANLLNDSSGLSQVLNSILNVLR